MTAHGQQQPEKPLTRLGGRQQVFADFGEKIERYRSGVIGRQREAGVYQLTAIQGAQLAILAPVIVHSDVGEPLQTAAEAIAWLADPPRHAAQLTLIAGEEADDEISLSKRISPQNDGIAHPCGHPCTLV